VTVPARAESIRWLAAGTALLLDRVDVTDLKAPSLLPGSRQGSVRAPSQVRSPPRRPPSHLPDG
jgi:hypothetical protein